MGDDVILEFVAVGLDGSDAPAVELSGTQDGCEGHVGVGVALLHTVAGAVS